MNLRVCLLLAILLGTPLLSQRTRLDEAWDLVANGHSDEAVTLLHNIIGTDPRNADAHLLLGSLLAEGGDKTGALDQLREGLRLRPNSAEAQNALGEAYNRFDDPKTARGYFEKALEINPAFATAHLNLGLVLLQGDEFTAAAEHFRKVVKANGKSADIAYAQYLWAKAWSALNNPKEAAGHLEQAVKLAPDMAEAWADLGEARKLVLDDAGSMAAEQKSVELNPKDPIAQYRLGAEYLRRNQLAAAVEHLEAAERLDAEDQSTLNALQIALRREGRTRDADAAKQRLANLLLRRDRANQDAVAAITLNNEGAAMEKSGDLAGAAAKYEEAVKLYPSHSGVRVNYAVILLRLGRWTEGLTQLHEAQLRRPNDAKIQAALKDALAQAPRALIPSGIQ